MMRPSNSFRSSAQERARTHVQEESPEQADALCSMLLPTDNWLLTIDQHLPPTFPRLGFQPSAVSLMAWYFSLFSPV